MPKFQIVLYEKSLVERGTLANPYSIGGMPIIVDGIDASKMRVWAGWDEPSADVLEGVLRKTGFSPEPLIESYDPLAIARSLELERRIRMRWLPLGTIASNGALTQRPDAEIIPFPQRMSGAPRNWLEI